MVSSMLLNFNNQLPCSLKMMWTGWIRQLLLHNFSLLKQLQLQLQLTDTLQLLSCSVVCLDPDFLR